MILGKVESLWFYGPELSLAITVLVLLLFDLVIRPSKRLRVTTLLAWVGTITAFIFSFKILNEPTTYLFDGMVASDPFANFFKMIIPTVIIILISYKASETNRTNQGEYYSLLLSMALGGFVLVSATNLLMVYLYLE